VGLSLLETRRVRVLEAFSDAQPGSFFIIFFFTTDPGEGFKKLKRYISLCFNVSKCWFSDSSYESVFKDGSWTMGIKSSVILKFEFLFNFF
jgi:hypothetical protein